MLEGTGHEKEPCHPERSKGWQVTVPLVTWCLEGRLPPRLYHVMVAWGCPTTTQFRSRVCPSTTVGDEVSILIGGETLGTGERQGRVGERLQSDSIDNAGDLWLLGTHLPSPLSTHIRTMGWTSALDGDDE